MNTGKKELNQQELEDTLIGRKVTKVSEDTLQLDDGRRLTFKGNEGGCSCSAGDYDLTELNGVDNVITKVEFYDDPSGDYHDDGEGVYRIFVYADNTKINLAEFSGTDGSGYYGTGYSVTVTDAG